MSPRCQCGPPPNLLARSYNGVDQYGAADWLASLHNPLVEAATTLLVRLKANVPSALCSLIGWSGNTSNAAPTARVYVDTGGKPHWFPHYSSTVGADIVATSAVCDSAWGSLGVVDDAGAVALYVDGAAAGTGSYTRYTGYPDPDFFTVGCVRYASTVAQYFPGDIAEVAVISRALSADEIARWHAGTLDLRAYGEDLILWDWQGEGGDTPARGINHGAGEATAYANMTAADIVEV